MSNLYKFVLDELNGLFKVYDNDVFLQDIPYFDYGSPFVFFNTNFSVACCSANFIDIIYHFADYTTIKNYSLDFSGIISSVEVGTSFDLGVWDNSYGIELFMATKNIGGDFQSLNETYLTFDVVSFIATGSNYGVSVPATTCDLILLTPEFDEIDLSIATLDDKVVNLHQKVDYLVTLLGQVHTLEQTLATKTDLQIITIDTTTLATKDDILTLATKTDILNIDLLSLNGNGSEFIDGVEVKVFGRDTVYTVERSFMSLYSDNGYTVHYDLTSVDGYKCTVPEALLTKHVAAV